MRRYVVDTSAWIDFFRGTERGRKVKNLILAPGKVVEIVTPTLVMAEFRQHYAKTGHQGYEADMERIRLLSDEVLPLDEATALQAGLLRSKHVNRNLSMVDCVLLAVAEQRGSKVLSLDGGFKGRAEAVYIGGGRTPT